MCFNCQVRAAAGREWQAETGTDADRETDPRAPGKAGTTPAGSDPEVEQSGLSSELSSITSKTNVTCFPQLSRRGQAAPPGH